MFIQFCSQTFVANIVLLGLYPPLEQGMYWLSFICLKTGAEENNQDLKADTDQDE
jgi:hypothetical protein